MNQFSRKQTKPFVLSVNGLSTEFTGNQRHHDRYFHHKTNVYRPWQKGSTLALSTRNRGWSGVAWALHCSTSCMYRNYGEDKEIRVTTQQRLQCMCGGDEWVKWGGLSTLRTWSLSSSWATSLPQACAILLPATRLPTIIEAGPTSVRHNHIRPRQTHVSEVRAGIYTDIKENYIAMKIKLGEVFMLHLFLNLIHAGTSGGLPGCFCLGLGRLVTHVWGHMRTLQGCKAPSKKRCLVSDIWMPPRGAFGSVLAGTRARQYTPTWWMLSMAWKRTGNTCKNREEHKLRSHSEGVVFILQHVKITRELCDVQM